MINSKELKPGTLIEATADHRLRTDKDYWLAQGSLIISKGDILKVDKCSKNGGSAFTLRLTQVLPEGSSGTPQTGSDFLVSIKGCYQISSLSETAAQVIGARSVRDPKLNDDEEFVLVLASNPQQFYKTEYDKSYVPQWASESHITMADPLVLTSRIGQRKKFKNMATLLGFLHNCSGLLSSGHWWSHFRTHPNDDQAFNLKGLDDLPDWVGGAESDIDFTALELRKYNTTTRKVGAVKVDFDLAGYLSKFKMVFQLTFLYGEAVSALVNQLAEGEKLSDYPFVFSAKYHEAKFPETWKCPKDKDIYIDLALKKLGLKKKEVPLVNKNGFAAVAFKTQAELDQFAAAYQQEDTKKIAHLNLTSLDQSVDFSVITRYFKQANLWALEHEELLALTSGSTPSAPAAALSSSEGDKAQSMSTVTKKKVP